MVVPRLVFGLNKYLLRPSEWLVWYSGLPIAAGFLLALVDLFILFPAKRRRSPFRHDPIGDPSITVALTAYNDQESIADAVADFLAHPMVRNVIVVSNNSTDATFDRALAAGAIAFDEPRQGYGHCVYRCLKEATEMANGGLVALCEGAGRSGHTISKSLSLTYRTPISSMAHVRSRGCGNTRRNSALLCTMGTSKNIRLSSIF